MNDARQRSVPEPAGWQVLEHLPAAAYACDPEGRITFFNRPAAALWGREPKLNDLADRYCGSHKLFSPAGAPIPHDQCWMARTLRDQKAYGGHKIVVERPDGSRRNVLAHANPLRDVDGTLLGAVNVLMDVTLSPRAGQAPQGADPRSHLLKTLAHELRNPLGSIRAGLHVVRDTGSEAADVEQALKIMERQVDHLVRLVDGWLGASRFTEGPNGPSIETQCESHGTLTLGQPAALATELEPQLEKIGATAAARGPARNVLVVDDNEDHALGIALVLKQMGHRVQITHDGLEALRLAADSRPDAMLLDIGLPEMDGHAVCKRVRAEPWGKTMIMVAISGWGREDDKRRSKEAGFDAHLVKPVRLPDLERLLSSPSSRLVS